MGRRTYGAPGVHGELRRLGVRCDHKRIARPDAESGLVGVHARRRWRTARPRPGPCLGSFGTMAARSSGVRVIYRSVAP